MTRSNSSREPLTAHPCFVYTACNPWLCEKAEMPPSLGVLLLLCSLAVVVSETELSAGAPVPGTTWRYGGDDIDIVGLRSVLDAAVAEIEANKAWPQDCGVDVAFEASVESGPPGSVALEIPGRIDPDSDVGVRLARNVYTVAEARQSCYEHWDCRATQVFTLGGTDVLLAVYYTTSDVQYLAPLSGDGGDPEVWAPNWVATVAIDRTLGYDCASDEVRPLEFWNMWAGRMEGVIQDVASYAGVALADVVTDADVVALSPIITQYFKTFAHAHRLWPNYDCRLTPVLRRPETGCIAATCPSHTVCPTGHRLHAVDWGLCLGDGGAQSLGPEVLLAGPPVVDTDTETLNWPGQSDDPISLYGDLRYDTYGSNLACGFDVGRGVCIHSSLLDASSGDAPAGVCACTGAAVPVANDTACSFDGFDSLVFGGTAGDCMHPQLGLICSLQGTCGFNRGALAWGSTDPFSNGAVVQCECDPP